VEKTLLGFGLACIVAAIVGGGLRAFDVEIPVVNSLARQLLLGALGLILVATAERDILARLVFGQTTETKGPTLIKPGERQDYPIKLTRNGPVEVTLDSVEPPKELYVTICAGPGTPCPSRQIPMRVPFAIDLPSGSAAVSVFNFAGNPAVTYTIKIERPK
jgi:hypothetical protein